MKKITYFETFFVEAPQLNTFEELMIKRKNTDSIYKNIKEAVFLYL